MRAFSLGNDRDLRLNIESSIDQCHRYSVDDSHDLWAIEAVAFSEERQQRMDNDGKVKTSRRMWTLAIVGSIAFWTGVVWWVLS